MKIVFAGVKENDILHYQDLNKMIMHEVVVTKTYQESLDQCRSQDANIIVLGKHLRKQEIIDLVEVLQHRDEGVPFPQIIYLAEEKIDYDNLPLEEDICSEIIASPVPLNILSAKIENLLQLNYLHHVIERKEQDLIKFEQHILHETKISQSIFNNISNLGDLDDDRIRYSVSSTSVYNGEVLLATVRARGDIVIMLGDFAGFGLPAAIGTYPVAETFYTMIARGFTLHHVIIEMNKRLKSILPREVFCRAAVAEFDMQHQTLYWWNSGFPDGFIRRSKGGVDRIVSVYNTPMGVVGRNHFNPEVQTIPIYEGDKLVFMTSEILKIYNSNNQSLDLSIIQAALQYENPNRSSVEIIHQVIDHFLNNEFYSKPTIVEVAAQIGKQQESTYLIDRAKLAGLCDWQSRIEFHPQTLRQYDPLPMLINMLMENPDLKPHKSSLYTIIAELYTNALDHGLLKLESKLKQSPNGFMDYLKIKQERLEKLSEGHILFDFALYPTLEGGCLVVAVEDSGEGFDYTKVMNSKYNMQGYSGRGILLLRGLCETVAYNAKGNRIEVGFSWNSDQIAAVANE